MALLDTVRQSLQAQAQPTQVGGIQDTTGQLQQLARAKTGKAVPAGTGASPRATSLQEQIAAGQAATGAAELQTQGTIQAAQLGQQAREQEQKFTAAKKELKEEDLTLEDNHLNQVNSLLNTLSRSDTQLSHRKKLALLEQAGTMARMSNQDYIHASDMQAQRDRLDNADAWNYAMAQSTLADERELLDTNLDMQRAFTGDERAFREYMNQIDEGHAMDIAEAEAAAAKKQAIWGAIGSMASTGAGAYSTQQQGGFDSEYQKSEASGSAESRYAAYKGST